MERKKNVTPQPLHIGTGISTVKMMSAKFKIFFSYIEFPETHQETLIRQLNEDIEQKIVAITALSEQIGMF